MTDNEKLAKVKLLLGVTDNTQDNLLAGYLSMAGEEILNWVYTNYPAPPDDAALPKKYEQVQIQAVITAMTVRGGEGETAHSENGVTRDFKYEDMLAYIHSNVYPYIGLKDANFSDQ